MKTGTLPKLILTFALVGVVVCASANTYPVTKTVDNTTTGTLRWAITQANATAGLDTITFAILSVGNTFESSGVNSWPVITLASVLPAITDATMIDGSSQPDTNLGFMPGKTVGVDGFVQGNINYPDVYLVCGYTLPSTEPNLTGNGLSINAPNSTLKGLAISGFGNSNTTQATAIAHADISINYASAARVMNTLIIDCFVSSDPRGVNPTLAARRSKSSGVLILGNNNFGSITRNYVAHSGGYGIVFHGNIDNTTATPNLMPSTNWIIQENHIINIGTSTTTTGGRAADGISLLHTKFCQIRYNYIQDWEQFGIDLGHNTDDNRVENNTLTGFVKIIGSAPCGSIRTGFSSERDTVSKNDIFNNTSTRHLAGIWADESTTSFAGGVVKNNQLYYYTQNKVNDNVGSGIVVSTNGTGTVSSVTITKNRCFNNTGLGIDLNFIDVTGSTLISVNDDGDVDSGPNALQNFPIIDSVKFNASLVYVWGKAPANSILEFFTSDGQANKHGGLGLNYGEGKNFIASAVEGSAGDAAGGTGSYNIDGNVATNNVNMFQFVFSYSGLLNVDSLTATATVNGNTSEFGPKTFPVDVLGCTLLKFTAAAKNSKATLNWEAICDNNFMHYLVEHSTDGVRFSSLGRVYADAVGSIKRSQFEHLQHSADIHFYRLKMVNRDGTFKYSQTITINNSSTGTNDVLVTQNPFNHQISFNINRASRAELQITLLDAAGNTLVSKQQTAVKGKNLLILNDLGSLPSGLYRLVVASPEKIVVKNVLKK